MSVIRGNSWAAFPRGLSLRISRRLIARDAVDRHHRRSPVLFPVQPSDPPVHWICLRTRVPAGQHPAMTRERIWKQLWDRAPTTSRTCQILPEVSHRFVQSAFKRAFWNLFFWAIPFSIKNILKKVEKNVRVAKKKREYVRFKCVSLYRFQS